MSLLTEVFHSLKWKRSNEYCAKKLGISLQQYKQLKWQVLSTPPSESAVDKVIEFKEDLEKGTAEIKGIAVAEPKSPEEIINILKIDTKKWKLSSYWNKEARDKWIVSALVTRVKETPEDHFAEVLRTFSPTLPSIPSPYINTDFERSSIGILSIQDLHFGKEGNETIGEDFENAIKDLLARAYRSHKLEKIVYVIGGDLLNMDTFLDTTTKGTPVNSAETAVESYKKAFDLLHWSIFYIKHFCDTLQVLYIPGNHDRLSSFHIAHALSKCFVNIQGIEFDVEYSERKVVTYGCNFFAFEHGDVTKKVTPLVYATEFASAWGSSLYRTCYTGHWHKSKTTEYVSEDETNGFTLKHLPSLSKSDYWHYHNKFTGNRRQAIMEIHDALYGKTTELAYIAI